MYRYVLFFIFSLLFGSLACGASGESVPLGGEWSFRKGYDPSYLTEFRAKDWGKMELDKNLQDLPGFETYGGLITLRRTLPPEVMSLFVKNHGLVFRSGLVWGAAEFYLNTRLLGRLGELTPYKSGNYQNLLLGLNTSHFRWENSQENVLIIVLRADPFYARGGMGGVRIQMGPAGGIYRDYYGEMILAAVICCTFLLLGAYHLLLWLRIRSFLHYFYFSFFCFSYSVFLLANSSLREFFCFGQVKLIDYLDQLSLMLLALFFLSFLLNIYNGRNSRIGFWLMFYWVILILINVFGPYHWMWEVFEFWALSLLIGLPYILILTCKKILHNNTPAKFLGGGVLVLSVGVSHDVFVSTGSIDGERFPDYIFITLALGITGWLANRFAKTQKEVEELNQDLELQVIERTQRLRDSLFDVQTLKNRQDADYFLTSLLLNPLQGNYSNSDRVLVDVFTRQKKRLDYEGREVEVGGDLCVAYDIHLRKQEFTVFLNADAMGKSMQGAGGALVLGTVFKSIITRTKSSEEFQNFEPGFWLWDCIREIQEIFISFDGLMLISGLIGILDKQNGKLLYSNTMCPAPVLYRNSTAAFLPGNMQAQIGDPDLFNHTDFPVLQMLPGDILILGSDGRDDLLLPSSEDVRVFNYDESLFLSRVEEGQGELKAIYKAITNFGVITDDFSLMRIEFSPQEISGNS